MLQCRPLLGSLRRLRFCVVTRSLSDKRPKFSQQFQQQHKQQANDPKRNLKGFAKELEKFASKEGRDSSTQFLIFGAVFGFMIYEITKVTFMRNWLARQFKHTSPEKTDDEYDPSHELDEHLQELLDQVMKDMKISLYDREKYLVFFTDNLSVYCKQYFTPISVLPIKGVLGVPFYVTFSDTKPVDFTQLKHRTAYIPVKDPVQIDLSCLDDRTDTEELKETFVLSDNAKKFLLATQSYELCSAFVLTAKLSQKSVYVLMYATVASTINQVFNLFRYPLIVRLGMYAMCLSATGMYGIALNHMGRKALDETIDQMVCRLGLQYSQGGVEFYSKCIRRAQLLRELVPEALEYFDENGDLVKDRGEKLVSLPLKERLDNCKKIAANQENGVELKSNSFWETVLAFEYDYFSK